MALQNPINRNFTLATGQVVVGTSSSSAASVGLDVGQLLIGNGVNSAPSAATLTAGSGISLSNAAGSITITAQAMTVTTNTISANTTAVANQVYIITNTSTLTLPAPTVGAMVRVLGTAGGYTIVPSSGVSIQMGQTTGTTSAISQTPGDTVWLIGASTTAWIAESMIGTFNLT